MSNVNNVTITILLSSAVIAALITSLTNLVVSVFNNRRLRIIEQQKSINEIDRYRYSRLYEMLLHWHDYDSELRGESPPEIAYYRLLDGFLDNSMRYDIIKPLLDESFVLRLDRLRERGDKLLEDLIKSENPDGSHELNFLDINHEYFKNGMEFSKILKDSINKQLKILLTKNDGV